MKFKFVLLILFTVLFCSVVYAQSRDDSAAALQYVIWSQQAINEGRWEDAIAALERGADFADVSSDISFLLAQARLHFLYSRYDREAVLQALDAAIDTNRWEVYSPAQAMLLKAEQLIAMRRYTTSLTVLDGIGTPSIPVSAALAGDAAALRLSAMRALAVTTENLQTLAQFRSLLLTAMDRYPRDPRPVRIFFEYARNRFPVQSSFPVNDQSLFDLAMRRLPFLLEADPELAWMAAQFVSSTEEARRLASSYRTGGLSGAQTEGFKPNPASIPVALNIGLIDDFSATDELFSMHPNESLLILDKDTLINVYRLLRSEEGRDYFTRNLLSFTGIITSDDDGDGYTDSRAYYTEGSLIQFALDKNQSGVLDLIVSFNAGNPVNVFYISAALPYGAEIIWERFPSVREVKHGDEVFSFRPADLLFAPVGFIELGGSGRFAGLLYPVPSYSGMDITQRTLISFCSTLKRPSVEFENATETIFMEYGIPLYAVETINQIDISITEFDRGLPVVQYVDLDLDGRMETIRRFRLPSGEWYDILNYRQLLASSESDWEGNGRFITRELYLEDGSIVYYFDMDGSGEFNYSETGIER